MKNSEQKQTLNFRFRILTRKKNAGHMAEDRLFFFMLAGAAVISIFLLVKLATMFTHNANMRQKANADNLFIYEQDKYREVACGTPFIRFSQRLPQTKSRHNIVVKLLRSPFGIPPGEEYMVLEHTVNEAAKVTAAILIKKVTEVQCRAMKKFKHRLPRSGKQIAYSTNGFAYSRTCQVSAL